MKRKNIKIRKLEKEDTQKVYELGSSEQYFCGFWPKEIIDSLPSAENVAAYVAEVEGNLAGFILGKYSPAFKKMEVENIYVSPEHRSTYNNGKVISGHLAERIFQDAEDRGAKTINCLVDETHKMALKMNERNGIKFYDENFKWGTHKIK